ncbi:Protein SufA [Buchnera aphidicola (Eriosoma grossulariae)]|uniref:iron-sulfur cluster assembly accessory protein n=1 Tax=Buchnera aphidicola TaxID=9 RepID=UPI003463FC7A
MIENLKTKDFNKKTKWEGVILTKKAENQIFSLIKESDDFIGIRIQIKKSGCAGFRYNLKRIKNKKKEELIFYFKNFVICIPLIQIDFINKMKIDFVKEGINQVFKFDNAQTKNFCGCGESFELIL